MTSKSSQSDVDPLADVQHGCMAEAENFEAVS